LICAPASSYFMRYNMTSNEHKKLLEDVCTDRRDVNKETLRRLIMLAIEIGREGREGRKIGTMFIIADHKEVLKRSRCLILDPLANHPEEARHIENPNLRETIKELAQLDGAFVISDNGVFISATRYIDASSRDIDLPLGLGSRHMAAASISKETKAVAVVVSESSIVRVFDDGEMISEIIPELWLLKRHSSLMEKPYRTKSGEDVTVVSKDENSC